MPTVQSPYGRHTESRERSLVANGPLPIYDGETYYGLPAIKSSDWGWLIVGYFFVGGLGGASQLLATVADRSDRWKHRHIIRMGRYIALACCAASPVFLIADLRYRRRWYNMLRIFRKTSMMSIGAWTLTVFGNTSALLVFGQLLEDRGGRRLGRRITGLLQLPAGLAGTIMSFYTGGLLASTSVPLWGSAPRLLPALFGASAASTAAAALTLALEASGAPSRAKRRVEHFGLVAEAAELALLTAAQRHWERQDLAEPLRRPENKLLKIGAIGLGIAVPLTLNGLQALTGRKSKKLSALASISALVGGVLLRRFILQAGNDSGRLPQDYFKFTQPGAQPETAPLSESRAISQRLGEQTPWPLPSAPSAASNVP